MAFLKTLVRALVPIIIMNTGIDAVHHMQTKTTGLAHARASVLFLRDDLKTTHAHLDELNATVQYLYQVLNKNTIKVASKRHAHAWLLTLQTVIRQMLEIKERSIEGLKKQALTVQAITKALSNAITANFAELTALAVPADIVVSDEKKDSDQTAPAELISEEERVAALIEENKLKLGQLQQQSQTVGLTKWNMLARKLDAINDEYHITWLLEQTPRALAVLGLGIYLTPYKRVKNLPGLGYLKTWIGTPASYDKEGLKEINEGIAPAAAPAAVRPDEPAPKKFNFAEFRGSLDFKLFKDLAGFSMGFIASNSTYNSMLAPVKSAIRQQWKRFKGFELPRDSYSYKFPDITLDDKRLVGLETQIAQMRNLVDYMTNPESYDKVSASVEKGILLTGPSRSGKTFLAQALAGTLTEQMRSRGMSKKVAFKQVRGGDIVASRDGIKSIIDDARNHAPCILFIDELHNLPLQTKEGGDTLSEFLTMADALTSSDAGDSVFVIGATNRAYMLDDALLKPGRFGMRIHFENPPFEKRRKFFEVMCEHNAIDPKEFDIDALARQTEGCSFGELDMVFKHARVSAHTRSLKKQADLDETDSDDSEGSKVGLNQSDFQETVQKEIFRIRTEEQLPLTPEARKFIAAHQAGRALMYATYEKDLHAALELVTIRGKWRKITETRWNDPKVREEHAKKKTSYGHVIVSHESEAVEMETNPLLLAKIKLAGAVAEEILIGVRNYGYHTKDRRKALDFIEKVIFQGLKKEDFSAGELKELMVQAKRVLAQCELEVRNFLILHKAQLAILATQLEKDETLTAQQVKELVTVRPAVVGK